MKHKILIIHEYLGFFGGAEQSIYHTAKYIKNHFELTYVHSSTTELHSDLYSKNFESIYQIDFSSADDALIRKQLREILHIKKPNLIYMHKCLNIPAYETLLESRIPVIHMIHDHEVYCLRKSKYYPINRKICTHKAGLCCLFLGLAFLKYTPEGRLRFQQVHYFKHKKLVRLDQQFNASFAPSNYMQEELAIQGYDRNKIYIFPPVVPSEVNSDASFSKENKIFFVGKTVRGKGLDLLIKALTLINTPFKLIVLGDGSQLSYCKQLVKEMKIEESVDFEGFVPFEKIPDYLKDGSVGVVPSVWPEPFGMTGIEFMHSGLPVVGFNSGGIKDWLQDGVNGYLVPHMDIQGLANKIEYLLIHKDIAYKQGKAAKAFVFTHYQFKEHMARMIDFFRSMIQ